jgi:hypothetical protein
MTVNPVSELLYDVWFDQKMAPTVIKRYAGGYRTVSFALDKMIQTEEMMQFDQEACDFLGIP